MHQEGASHKRGYTAACSAENSKMLPFEQLAASDCAEVEHFTAFFDDFM
jgi:hypothetical protein